MGVGGNIDSSEGAITDSFGLPGAAVGLDGYEFMEEELDENYVPAREEVEEYARFLGMDVREDQDLFYIAKEGLKAPLPGSWRPCKSPRGTVYYYNFQEKKLQKEFVSYGGWITDYDKARELARKEGKMIFAYFSRSYAP